LCETTTIRGIPAGSTFCDSAAIVTTEQKIRDLCTRISSYPEGSSQFRQTLVELRDVLEVHIAELRQKRAASKVTE